MIRKRKTIINLGILVVEFIFLAIFLGDKMATANYLIFRYCSLLARYLFLPMTYFTATYLVMELLSVVFPLKKGINRYLKRTGRIVIGVLLAVYFIFLGNLLGVIPYLFKPVSAVSMVVFFWNCTYKIPYILIWVGAGAITSISWYQVP